MAFIDTSDLAEASSFRRRLVPCVAKVAGIVLAEASTGRMVRDSKRKYLAGDALRDPVNTSSLFVWGVLSNAVIAAAGLDASDGDIEYQVTQMWSTIAGVTHEEETQDPDPAPQ